MRFIALIFAAALWFASAGAPANATACTAGCLQWSTGTAFAGTSTSASLTAVGAGHAIRVGYCVSVNTLTVTITDGTNTYTPITPTSGGATFKCGAAFAINVASGSPTVTATASGTVAQLSVWAEEWSGIVTTSALDGTGSASSGAGSGSAGQTFNSGNWTTSTSGDQIWGFSQSNGGSIAGAGFTTSVSDPSSGYGSAFATQGSAGSINVPFATIGATFAENDAVGFALKQTGGGGPTCGAALLLHVGC